MAIKTLYKLQYGELLVVTGHLSRDEIKAFMKAGYRFQNPLLNKNGIRVEVAK